MSQAESEWAPKGLGGPIVPTPHLSTSIQAGGNYHYVARFEVDANCQVELSLKADSGVLTEFLNWGIGVSATPYFETLFPILSIIADEVSSTVTNEIIANFNPVTIPGSLEWARLEPIMEIITSKPRVSFPRFHLEKQLSTTLIAWASVMG